MALQQINVLVVEDDPAFARLLQETLTRATSAEFRVTLAQRMGDIPDLLDSNQIDMVLLDLVLPDSQGLDTVVLARGLVPGAAIVVLTGSYDRTLGLDAVKQGAQDYLIKGEADGAAMEQSILYAIERQRTQDSLKATIDQKEQELEQLVGALERSRIDSGQVKITSGTPTERILSYIQTQSDGADMEMVEKATGLSGMYAISVLARLMEANQILRKYPLFFPVETPADRIQKGS